MRWELGQLRVSIWQPICVWFGFKELINCAPCDHDCDQPSQPYDWLAHAGHDCGADDALEHYVLWFRYVRAAVGACFVLMLYNASGSRWNY
jgi:hypothetical protein